MDLNEQDNMNLSERANVAVYTAFADADVAYDATTARVAKILWLDGYKAGVDTVQALAEAAFSKALS